MKANINLATEHLKMLENNNPSFNGEVIFCKKANEYVVNVVNDINEGLHLHITDTPKDFLSKEELKLLKEVKK